MKGSRQPIQFAGADPCKGGWAVSLACADPAEPTAPIRLQEIFTTDEFSDVLDRTAHCRLLGVHIPIGLSMGPDRQCDLIARKLLGKPRAASVFPPPVRQCLNISDYATASRTSLAHSLHALNMQTFHIIKKIQQVDALITADMQTRIREIHPELSFYALNRGLAVNPGKKTTQALRLRRKLLEPVFADLKNNLPQTSVRKLALDDVHDSLIAAWTAWIPTIFSTLERYLGFDQPLGLLRPHSITELNSLAILGFLMAIVVWTIGNIWNWRGKQA